MGLDKVADRTSICRRVRMSRRRTIAGALLFSYIMMVGFVASVYFLFLDQDVEEPALDHSRKIRSLADWSLNVSSPPSSSVMLEVTNCTPSAIEQFPHPLMSRDTRLQGGLVVHFLVCLYMFLAIAVVCDEYFVPSLQSICKALKMEEDVAGATFMAAGSSAPELATSVIAVFIAKDDIGVGTVVGSAVYNIAFVVAVCGLFAGKTMYLHWWPMVRDCFFYTISIVAMLLIILDSRVTWVESLLLLLLYASYIVFMFFNERVERWVTGLKDKKLARMEEAQLMAFRVAPVEAQPSTDTLCTNPEKTDLQEEAGEGNGVFQMPEGVFHRILWLVSLPIFCCTYFTIPDVRKERWQKWFAVAFLSTCVWISLQSYVLVWMITIIGDTLAIPDTVMGLTFLAAGVSVPDAIASLIVAREGYGDMAISNAIGSNVFDILLCLGLPWFLQTAIIEPGNTVPVQSKGLTYTTLTLIATVVFLLVATHLNGWKLNKRYGFLMLVWYVAFMVLASLYELNVFGQFNPPSCPSDF